MLFSSFTDAITLKRLSQTSGKSVYATVSGTLYGSIMPIDSDANVIALKITGQAYKFTTDGANDIRVGDILTFNSEEYGVRGLQRFTQKAVDVKYVVLEKRQKYS